MYRVNEANKVLIIWLCLLLREWNENFLTGDQELQLGYVRLYGPEIDQSHHMKISQPYENINYV